MVPECFIVICPCFDHQPVARAFLQMAQDYESRSSSQHVVTSTRQLNTLTSLDAAGSQTQWVPQMRSKEEVLASRRASQVENAFDAMAKGLEPALVDCHLHLLAKNSVTIDAVIGKGDVHG